MNNHPKAILRIVKLVVLLSPLLLAACGDGWAMRIAPPALTNDLSASLPPQPPA